MKRYQVRSDRKLWKDEGPDLLRELGSAVSQVKELGTALATARRKHDGTWTEPRLLERGQLPERIAALRGGDVLQVRAKEPFAYVRAAEFLVPEYLGATPRAEVVNALMAQGDPSSEFAGIFVCKNVAGSTTYSDHAWGDAVDRSRGDNDKLFDWTVRMARGGHLELAYVIGSRNGKVVSASAPGFAVEPGGGDSSHLWHVHASVVKHTGRPPCA